MEFSDAAKEKDYLHTVSEAYQGSRSEECVLRIKELLREPESRRRVLSELRAFSSFYVTDRSLLEHRPTTSLPELTRQIADLDTGDPRIKEKMELDIQVAKLKMLKANHMAQKYEMEDMEIKRLAENVGFVWALEEPTGEPFEIAPIRALMNAYQLLGGDAFSRMLSLMAGAWQGTPNSLRASMLSGMALFVKTYEAELNDRAFIRRMSIVSPEEIIRLGRIETDIALRFARIIRDKYNGEGTELPYRFKR